MVRRIVAFIAALLAVTGCAATPSSGWVGDGVHAVDGYWIGTESPCATGDAPCNEVLQDAKQALSVSSPNAIVVRAVQAAVPNQFKLATGATIEARIGVGILVRTFSVLYLADGSPHVVPQMCEIASQGNGPVQVFHCDAQPANPFPGMNWNGMDPWRVGREPTVQP
jgi:hypothetical protein